MQVPVQVSQHAPVGTHGLVGVQAWPTKKTLGATHWTGLATGKQAPVAGLQHAPPLGKHESGWQDPPVTTVPPAMVQAAASMRWHRPQQQQRDAGVVLHCGGGNAAAQDWPIEETPPICWQVPALTTVHMLLWQQAPGPSPAHWAAVHGVAPVKVPPLRTQSQLEPCTQLPLRQQNPKTGLSGQMPGVHAAPGR